MQTRRLFLRGLFGAAVAIAVAPLAPVIEANRPSGWLYATQQNVFIPNYDASGKLIMSFARNPRKFNIRKYVQYAVYSGDRHIANRHELEVEAKV